MTESAGKNGFPLKRTSIQQQFIMRSLLDMYKKIRGGGLFLPEDEAMFREWAVNEKVNRKEKETALRLAYIGIFRQIPKNEAEITESFFSLIKNVTGSGLAAAVARFEIKAELAPENTLDSVFGTLAKRP